MMKIESGHYVVCKTQQAKKPFLVRVNQVSKDGIIEGLLEKECHLPESRNGIEVTTKDVLINLGDAPHPGNVYGIQVSSLYRGPKAHDSFGTLHYFYRPKKEVRLRFSDALSKAYRRLSKMGLGFLVDSSEVVFEVHPAGDGSKYGGCYRSTPGGKKPPRIEFLPEVFPASEYQYLIFHELAHCMHLQYVNSPKLNAKWIKAVQHFHQASQYQEGSSSTSSRGPPQPAGPPFGFQGATG